MVDPVASLRAKRAKILADAQREAEALEADARDLERLNILADKYGLALVEKSHTSAANGQRVVNSPAVTDSPTVPIDINGPSYRAAISVAEQAIRAAGTPLELSELFDACESVGVRLGGQRPQSTLSAYLSHEKSTVESIRKGVYWLKGVPIPH